MGQIYDVVKAFLEEDDWPLIELAQLPAIKTGFEGQAARWDCYARPLDDDNQLLFYSLCPFTVPREKRPAVMEYTTRVNYGLRMGNFELNLDDGEVRFKTSLDCEGGELTSALVKQLIYANVLLMDQYLPGLLGIMYGDLGAREAIQQVEGLPTARA